MSQSDGKASILPQDSAQPPRSAASAPLPDVASETTPRIQGTLDRVGMSGIEVALLERSADGTITRLPARVDAYVSLDKPEVKGIHMSRLFLKLQERLASTPFTPEVARELLREFLASHQGLSLTSALSIRYEHLVSRASLLSQNRAWRSYPVSVSGTLSEGKLRLELEVQVTYSSTCPCSAALSRQLTQEKFEEEFGGSDLVNFDKVRQWLGTREALGGAPHSQRSRATVRVVLEDELDQFPVDLLIEHVEAALGTAVQAAVKRADEAEFARLNAVNLMFCEDAARRIRAGIEKLEGIVDYRIESSHLESLHPHDAVAIVTRGVPGGLKP